MPVQRTLFGRPVPAISPRKIVVLLATISIFAVITLVFTLPSSIPAGPSLGKFTDHKISLPKLPKQLSTPSILNPFRPAAHAPQYPQNSTSGESKWYENWNWLSPFSSSVTLDENRSILPPLSKRYPVYTYYDHTLDKDEELKDAENELLLTWRRAWWAQGFKPIILSPAEAMNNPLYAELQQKELEPPLKTEFFRWLAWENMGSGILCNYLTLPMGTYEDPLLSYLRRGQYGATHQLTRFEKLGSGIFLGDKPQITAALKAILANKELNSAKDFISAAPEDTFFVDPHHESLAYYDAQTLDDKYSKIAKSVGTAKGLGLSQLNKLMTSHLHSTWQNIFSSGIAVLKPQPAHMSAMVEPAWTLAQFLAQCAESPLPASCPPNLPRCKPCVSSTPMKVGTPPAYLNTSSLYTIGTVPHPFTFAALTSLRESIDVRWIRREMERDTWVSSLTKRTLGTGVSGAPRVIKFKEAVASDYGKAHSLWITAEKDIPHDLDWHFGFPIPKNTTDTGKSETPVPGPERRPQPVQDIQDGPVATKDEKVKETTILKKAKEFIKSRTAPEETIKGAIEAWNLADTEAWRFARAFLARSRVERLKWEDEEKKYAGGAGAERGKSEGWGRWFDD
ncbi:hypothetical protein LHYA1_G006484 [Lachnellula hyalina]|uniref:Uncharacterized protein n=1 Tax=Lachnellula hyalina TaxID=1316788 RepID=A0A8H8QYE7_9HELO|nr:uncharacterized protein LHYA1_G006484 [Lachnellula hyalina]TVY25157.1 hypothetical protein LHYA1_G006484 [Lachnellula hyalina]